MHLQLFHSFSGFSSQLDILHCRGGNSSLVHITCVFLVFAFCDFARKVVKKNSTYVLEEGPRPITLHVQPSHCRWCCCCSPAKKSPNPAKLHHFDIRLLKRFTGWFSFFVFTKLLSLQQKWANKKHRFPGRFRLKDWNY